MKLLDPDSILGKIGNLPSSITSIQGIQIYHAASKANHAGSISPTFAVIGAGTGKGAIILGYLTKSLGGAVFAYDDWTSRAPAFGAWFNRMISMHRLGGVVRKVQVSNAVPEVQHSHPITFVLIEDHPHDNFLNILKHLDLSQATVISTKNIAYDSLQQVEILPGNIYKYRLEQTSEVNPDEKPILRSIK